MVTKPIEDAAGGGCQAGIQPTARGTLPSARRHEGTSHTGTTGTVPSGNHASHVRGLTALVGEKPVCQSG